MASKWSWWHQGTGPNEYRIRELLRAIWDLHAMYTNEPPWLWRGQANCAFDLSPGIHTRITGNQKELTDKAVLSYTRGLLAAARRARLDRHEGTTLPDMALLAMLQHHGAATPLLDVSLDPMISLYMGVVSPNPADDERDGVLFSISRPVESVAAFDSRSFTAIYNALPKDSVLLYTAPDVSERLRIQRGHFLLGKVSRTDERCSLPISVPSGKQADTWLSKRMKQRGVQGPVPPSNEAGTFRVTAAFKVQLRTWLEKRSGLTKEFVYPTNWHNPHLGSFAASHGRRAAF